MTTTSIPVLAAAGSNTAAREITDKRGYAQHLSLSPRMVDHLLQQGLPHLAIGKRRVRIVIAEADRWMHEQFAVQRRGTAGQKGGV